MLEISTPACARCKTPATQMPSPDGTDRHPARIDTHTMSFDGAEPCQRCGYHRVVIRLVKLGAE